MGAYIDLTGHKYNMLTCVERVGRQGKQTLWKCICDCGREHITTAGHLRSNHTTRCKECGIESRRTHFKSDTDLYKRWIGIKSRCNNENNTRYKNYGARGISVCDEWENSFENFEAWSLENGYSKDLTIDRIDNNLGYSPTNCRWITNHEQQCNRSNNRLIEYNGKIQTLTEWSKEINICVETLRNRVIKWGVEKAFTQPVFQSRKDDKFIYNNQEYTRKQICNILNICEATFYNWLRKGMSIEEIFEKKEVNL